MIRKIISALLATILLAGLPFESVSAHVLKTDGNVGAVLHVKPDDNAVSGVSTGYELAFEDQAGKLNLLKCDCLATVLHDGKTITSESLTADDPQTINASVTFPAPAVYTLEVTGKPQAGANFQAFKLDYILRVTGGAAAADTQRSFPPLLWLGIGLASGLLLLALYCVETNVKSTLHSK